MPTHFYRSGGLVRQINIPQAVGRLLLEGKVQLCTGEGMLTCLCAELKIEESSDRLGAIERGVQ